MFKKNSMEFFVGLQSYLYYYYSGCTLKSHDHLLFPECSMVTCSFQNVLWSPDLVTWLWLTQSLSCLLLRCILGCLKCVGNLFPTRGSHNIMTYKRCVTNFIQTITLGILDQFWQYKWLPKALRKTFQTVPEMSQSDQYSLSYQQISQWSPSYHTLNCWYLGNCLT